MNILKINDIGLKENKNEIYKIERRKERSEIRIRIWKGN